MYNMQLSVLSLLKHFLHLFHCCFQKVQICILAVNKVKTWQSSPTLVLAFFQTWKQGIVQIISPHPLWLFLLHLFLELTKIYLAKINKGHTNIVYVFLKTIFFSSFFSIISICLPPTYLSPACPASDPGHKWPEHNECLGEYREILSVTPNSYNNKVISNYHIMWKIAI